MVTSASWSHGEAVDLLELAGPVRGARLQGGEAGGEAGERRGGGDSVLAQIVVSRCRPAGLEMSTLYLRAFQLPIFFVSPVDVTCALTCAASAAGVFWGSMGRGSSL